MLAVVGLVVVVISVLGGFALEGGPLAILIQPIEFLIIGGAAMGTLIISAPKHHLLGLAVALKKMLLGTPIGKPAYMDVLRLQYEIFVNARKHGFIALERDIAEPEKSSIVSKYASFLANHHAMVFLSDSLRLLVDGAVSPIDLDNLLDREMETHHEEATKPAQILSKVGDTLPGLGIVAAVLGIVISMGHIDGPAEIMGHKVAVALVGTFLGVLFAYGFVNPLAVGLEMATEKDLNYLACIKAGVVAFAKGSPPSVAVEFARRVIYDNDRPTVTELETATQEITPAVSAPPKKRAVKESLPPPVIIIKRGGKHKGGHHGGAWKVAYADFVTTMMALFIVLWAAGQDSNVRSSIANYFRNPTAPTAKSGGEGSGVLPANTGVVGPADARDPGAQSRAEGEKEGDSLDQAAAELRRGFEADPDLKGLMGQVQVEVTPEGLRVQLLERDESLFFQLGSAQVNASLTRVLAVVARVVGELPNDVMVEGHTDARQYSRDRRLYSNWELSADRANSARRHLEGSGLRARQVVRVVGHAENDLLHPENPLDPQNRRVSILVLRKPLASSRSASAEAATAAEKPATATPRAPESGQARPDPSARSGR